MNTILPDFKKELELRAMFDKFIANSHVNDAVYNTLIQAILEEIFPIGLHLSSSKLAQIFDISRTPVQIALVRLECSGLIRADANHRYITYEMNFHEGKDYNEYMLGLYAFSFRLAFKKGLDPYFQNLLSRRLDQLDREPDDTYYLEIENDFHRIIAQSTNNRELLAAFDAITLKGNVLHLRYEHNEMIRLFTEKHQPLNRKLIQVINGNDMLALDKAIDEHNDFMMLNICNWIEDRFF